MLCYFFCIASYKFILFQIRPAPNPPANEIAPAVPPRPPITKNKDLPPTPPPKTALKPPIQQSHGGHSHEKTEKSGGHQKREKKPKMSDAEVLAHLSKSAHVYMYMYFNTCTSYSTCASCH